MEIINNLLQQLSPIEQDIEKKRKQRSIELGTSYRFIQRSYRQNEKQGIIRTTSRICKRRAQCSTLGSSRSLDSSHRLLEKMIQSVKI